MTLFFGSLTLMLGFAVSGATASAFEAATGRRAGFKLLREPTVTAVAAVPVVTIGAAYIMARNLMFGSKRPALATMVGVVLLGLWSLVIGSATLTALAV
ncbi:DUF6949 family protein [Chenggangzhangella methanolivorans]|uniref:TrbC/VIRB2 family protein n=1 Tax=Chenggangzhangella methanolivorans TaxID=1437009 RepID=A0A9E6RG40_9HYPH|nr:hypothetical protein [Chenggangzhangella methanolivorans]QZO00756.1 hypothetical protein K6K41_03470 [Chenggangzhangella methanolivorans]